MYNHDLLNKMIDKFGMDKVTEFAEMVSFMHHVLYEEAKANGPDDFTEHNFERDWWASKFQELKNTEECITY
jgi:hypothetical protein